MSVAFLPGEIANALIRIRFAWGANLLADPATWVWTDVTTDVRFDPQLSITPMGRGGWLGNAQPAGCSFRVDNTTGAYSKGPGSVNYPNVRQNTPVQVQISLNNGGAWYTRFQGETTGFRPGWDANGLLPYVTVTASGILRRLDKGKREKRQMSPLTRAALAAAGSSQLFQFWSCEDGNTSKFAGSAINGGPALTAAGMYSFAAINPTTEDPGWLQAGLPVLGTQPIPQLSDGGSLSASFPAGNASAWAVQFDAWTPFNDNSVNPTLVRQLVEWTTPGGTFIRWRVQVDYNAGTAKTRLIAFKMDGTSVTLDTVGTYHVGFVEYTVTAAQSGGNINVTLNHSGSSTSGTFTTATLAGIASWTANPDQQVTTTHFGVCQVRLWNQATAPTFQISPFDPTPVAWNSYTGELATTRLSRVCAENSIPITIVGSSTTAMGPQSVGSTLDIIRECEAANLGFLYDGLGPGLGFVTREAKYNLTAAITLNMATFDVVGPFQPEDDDQQVVNLATVKRLNGSQATFEDATSPKGTNAIGDYDTGPTVNIATDAPLLNMAAWLVHRGTVDEPYRYPTLTVDFKAKPNLLSTWLPSVSLGSRVDVLNASTAALQHPLGDLLLLLEGYTEQITPQSHRLTANCSPYQPNRVAALNQTAELEMVGQTLAANLVPGATSLSLATAAGHALFSTSAAFPADFPQDLNVGGWQIHVTAASGASSPQTLTITASPNTSTVPAGTPVTLWRPAAALAL